ncbi:dihydroxy-acid and 6-phosphogluconate dehydratase [Aureobasidium sp. EXF-10727]|nr:dihydroxy-acid and 6-phosphogluconate dehydratase [Aureobasidium sp. EXF-10727]
MEETENKSEHQNDYDLSKPLTATTGLRQGLTSYGDAHFSLFLRKVFIKAAGYGEDALSRPIIGIINTYSAFNPCHANIPQLLEAVKRGVHLHGGLAIEFPTISIHESFASPTSMYLRNLMAMDTEEMIKAQPVDAVVAIGGCDKTVPAQLMGGISANKVVLPLVTGPMMPGSNRGVRVGACTDCRSQWAAYRAGEIDMEDIAAVNEELAPTGGTCGVMGTASTMACVTVALGLMPFDGASAAAVSSARLRIAEQTGANAVAAAAAQRLPQSILTKESFLNAITVLQAIGGSTNAVVHLMAIVNRHPDVAGSITLETFDEVGRKTPLLVDLKPSGENYGVGPIGNPGMPEAGVIPIPRKLGAQGVKDMLRISDGRMSGTAGGTIVLHISPESALPDSVFGCVEDGDLIECDVEKRLLRLHVSDEELAHRIAVRSAAKRKEDHGTKRIRGKQRGYRGLYERCVNQAEEGADFDFLTASAMVVKGSGRRSKLTGLAESRTRQRCGEQQIDGSSTRQHHTHTMSRTSTFSRAVGHLATPNVSSTTCRSCQLRLSAASQQRQLQTSATRPAITDRFKSVFGGKKKNEETTDVATTNAAKLVKASRKPETPGWYLPKENLPEEWAKTPKEDKEYVMATEGKDLERVGSEKWLEQQYDDKPKYKGWARVQKANGLTPKEAEEQVLKAAKEAGLTVDQEGLDFALTEAKQKFKLTKALRATTKMQIPDIIMHRASTLKDFQQAILFKPKPKKLSFALLDNPELMANKNIQVRGGRQTSVHKDRAVGRWKVIEEELVNRGLPVFGHGIKADRGFQAEELKD